jgi:putative RecB family exonuclease
VGMSFDQPLPVALSPSRLQDFQACPRRFQYASIERIRQPATYATAKGNFVHEILESLFLLPANERTIERARGFIDAAMAEVMTPEVREEIGLTDVTEAKLLREIETILVTYFAMEDPTTVHEEGVERNIKASVDGVPMLGILDRLDRNDDGSLTIVDYKTGSLPNRNFDAKTFANAEIYAALCEEALGERPKNIRLLYVAHGESIERTVTTPVIVARRNAARTAWERIVAFYERGSFTATPSKNTCRFCSFKEQCRASGVNVPAT